MLYSCHALLALIGVVRLCLCEERLNGLLEGVGRGTCGLLLEDNFFDVVAETVKKNALGDCLDPLAVLQICKGIMSICVLELLSANVL